MSGAGRIAAAASPGLAAPIRDGDAGGSLQR